MDMLEMAKDESTGEDSKPFIGGILVK